MCEGIREVVAGEAATVASHCAMWKVLPMGSSCVMLLQDYRHAVAGRDDADNKAATVTLYGCAYLVSDADWWVYYRLANWVVV